MKIVLMGVSGSGKSAVGRPLAQRLGWPLLEGDDFHPAANVQKMRRAEPLTDADRGPWLDALVAAMNEHEDAVVTCSALKGGYRDRLRGARGEVQFVHLIAAPGMLAARLDGRKGHFFNPQLLDSQLAALEPPRRDEALVVNTDAPPEVLALRIVDALGLCE